MEGGGREGGPEDAAVYAWISCCPQNAYLEQHDDGVLWEPQEEIN